LIRKDNAAKVKCIAHRRKFDKHTEIDKDELHQQRRIADDFDVHRGDPIDEPVGRQARNTGEHAENRSEEDTDDADEQRVQHADKKRARVQIGRLVGNQTLADFKPGFPFQKIKPRDQATFAHRVREVGIKKARRQCQ